MKSRANGAPIGKEPAMAKGVCGRLCHWGPLGAIGKLTKCEIILRKTYCQISLLEDYGLLPRKFDMHVAKRPLHYKDYLER